MKKDSRSKAIHVAFQYREFRLASSRATLLLLMIALVILFAPLLATTPQTGDGAEQLLTALHGGVLHPPGFPLQSWFNRLAVLLPWSTPAWRLSLVSLFGHLVAAVMIFNFLKTLDLPISAAVLGSLLYAFFPAVLYLGVQPELFGMANGIYATILWLCCRCLRDDGRSHLLRKSVVLGTLAGLAIAQHTITIVSLPTIALTLWKMSGSLRKRWYAFAAACLAFTGVTIICFGSLVLLKNDAVWPNWGMERSVSGILRHALRIEYGIFSLTALSGSSRVSSLSHWWEDALAAWNIMLALIPMALIFGKDLDRPGTYWTRGLLLSATFLGGVLLLFFKGIATPDGIERSYLIKFYGVLVIPLAIVMGCGWGCLLRRAVFLQKNPWIPYGVMTIWAASAGYDARIRANAASNLALAAFRAAIGSELPETALYISRSDPEVFYGVETASGQLRFPLAGGLSQAPWYWQTVIPKIEPRLHIKQPFDSIFTLIQDLARQGITIATTDEEIAQGLGLTSVRLGLLFLVSLDPGTDATERHAQAMSRLCPLTIDLKLLPLGMQPVAERIHRQFAAAFLAASEYWQFKNQTEAFSAAIGMAQSLQELDSRFNRSAACATLSRFK